MNGTANAPGYVGLGLTRRRTGQAVIGGEPGLRANVCPYPATKVDFCPHALMTWRNHHAVCEYAHTAHGTAGVETLCFSPHRILHTG